MRSSSFSINELAIWYTEYAPPNTLKNVWKYPNILRPRAIQIPFFDGASAVVDGVVAEPVAGIVVVVVNGASLVLRNRQTLCQNDAFRCGQFNADSSRILESEFEISETLSDEIERCDVVDSLHDEVVDEHDAIFILIFTFVSPEFECNVAALAFDCDLVWTGMLKLNLC